MQSMVKGDINHRENHKENHREKSYFGDDDNPIEGSRKNKQPVQWNVRGILNTAQIGHVVDPVIHIHRSS